MKSNVPARVAGLVLAVVIAIAVFGCSKKSGIQALIPNKAPSVDITSAPIDQRDTAQYSVHISWSGDDPDGRVDHFEYAIDPGDNTPAWQTTTKNDTTFTFASKSPYLNQQQIWSGESPHTFMIRAIDNQGAVSSVKVRSFFSTTVAPTVKIDSPSPSNQLTAKLTPSMTVSWTGKDDDGYLVGKAKPIKYKYHRFENPNPEIAWNIVKNKPDSLRKYYAARNFAGWDSVGGDTTSIQISGQSVGHEFIFVVVAFDTAGAYSPVWSLDTNMLWYEVGYAATLGPMIRAYNESFDFEMPSGGYTPTNATSWFHLEVPAANQLTVNWNATPPLGAQIQQYRWMLGGEVSDETQRSNEETDWVHWSAGAAGTKSCTIGPFTPGNQVFLYIEATDNNGLRSLMSILLNPVQPTFAKSLLLVLDTRLDTDQFQANGTLNTYAGTWPAQSELDTFLFARGRVPWRNTQVLTPAPFTAPGVFAGYDYDTLGTRLGIIQQSNGVPLSKLGEYRHVVWMVDRNAATYDQDALHPIRPMGTLRWMCQKGHSNTLGSYVTSGGSVWLLGGDAAYSSLVAYNYKTGVNGSAPDNDLVYKVPGITVFQNAAPYNELIPGRLMYDGAHWNNELDVSQVVINAHTILKAKGVPTRPWTSPGWNYTHAILSPDYSKLPAKMNRKSITLGDTLPPTRTSSQSTQFFVVSYSYDVEYMAQPTIVSEDMDPSPFNDVEQSVLDTLMDCKGIALAPNFALGFQQPVMTYYHGVQSPEFIFSGFDIWRWSRPDCIKLVDFVLNQIWRLPLNSAARTAPAALARPLVQVPGKAHATAVPSGVTTRLPNPRAAGR